jgi:polysaccharide biosynthesis transport protein
MSVQQAWAIIWAYRKETLIIAIVATLLAAGIAKLLPKTFVATTTLMVYHESHISAAQAEPTDPLETYINTEIQLMQTGDVLLPVVDKLNLTADSEYTAGFKGNNGTLREWVMDNLSKDIKIEQSKLGGQLIYISAAAASPELAAAIANTIAEVYLEQEHQRVGPMSERAKAYAQELAELKHKVSLAQDQVTAFRQRTGLTDSASQNPNIQPTNVEETLLTSLEQRYQQAQNDRRAAEVAANSDRATNTSVMGSNMIQQLKTQLTEQERALAQLRTTMGPAHPKVIEAENQVESTRRSLNAEVAAYSTNISSQLSAARELEQKLGVAVEAQRAKLIQVRKIQDEGTKFALELDSAQSVYKHALDGYDQIMFASGEHHLTVANRAVPPLLAAKPNKPVMAAMGALIGLLLGLALPFGYEMMFNRRVRCRDDFERVFGLPVLSEFDTIKPIASAA